MRQESVLGNAWLIALGFALGYSHFTTAIRAIGAGLAFLVLYLLVRAVFNALAKALLGEAL